MIDGQRLRALSSGSKAPMGLAEHMEAVADQLGPIPSQPDARALWFLRYAQEAYSIGHADGVIYECAAE